MQAKEAVALISRCSTQLFKLLFKRDSRFDVRKDHRGVPSIIQPNTLNLVRANNSLAEPSEFSLLVHEEEPALDNGEAAAGKSRSAHELDHVVGRECISANGFDNKGKTIRLTFRTLLGDNVEEDLGFIGVLEDYTSISLSLIFIHTKTDTVL